MYVYAYQMLLWFSLKLLFFFLIKFSQKKKSKVNYNKIIIYSCVYNVNGMNAREFNIDSME